MKLLNAIFLFSLLFLLGNCQYKNTTNKVQSTEKLQHFFTNSNTKNLSEWLDNPVELRLPGESKSTYSKTQATHVLHNFFEKYQAIDFQEIDKTYSTSSEFLVGRYIHNTGSFKVYLQVQKNENRYQISTIDFNID